MAKCAKCNGLGTLNDLYNNGCLYCHGTGTEPQEVAKVELTEEQKVIQAETNTYLKPLCDFLCASGDDCTPIKCRNWKVIQDMYNAINTAVNAERDRIMALKNDRLELGRAK